MALNAAIQSAVRTADKVTKSLQEEVLHQAWYGQDGFGAPMLGPAISRRAIVDRTRRKSLLMDGKLIEVRAILTFLGEIEADGAEGRDEPIDPRDILTLASDELTGPILKVEKMHDPVSGRPYMLTVQLGTTR